MGRRTDAAAALSKVVSALPGGGEARGGQRDMAEAVAVAMASGRHLVVQAGTGTGKSLAYLVPAVLSRRRVVVATATKALQDQLATKDLPFLARHLGRPFRYAVLKGRSNYLCRQRGQEVAGGEQLSLEEADGGGRSLGQEVRRLLAWAQRSPTGDRAELAFEPRPQAWAQLSVSALDCPGASECPSGDGCFAEAARERAAQADVVVVNLHLYCAHLASGGQVLPEHDVVVFDEAHELEDVASAALGAEVGAGRLRALARQLRSALGSSARPASGSATELANQVAAAGDSLEAALVPLIGRRLPPALGEQLADAVTLTAGRLDRAISALRDRDGDDQAATRALLAASHLAGDLARVTSPSDDQVAWVEEQPPVLKLALVDVGPLLSECLWGKVTAVLTSATVPPALPVRLGLTGYDQLDVGSPFPYPDHGLLYCPTHLPDRRRPGAERAVHDELAHLIETAGGRTLALFTSLRAMKEGVEAMRERVPFRILAQSEMPKPALLEAFAREESSCLFATMSFWQGVDVPGSTLSLVVIDRIPFPRPDDPLTEARRERAGPAAFRLVDLNRAATLLAQGAGRLIRSRHDRGVVAVLDRRLATASYRWDLVRALPPMARTRHRREVEAFLARRE